jgi:hypothetical protein
VLGASIRRLLQLFRRGQFDREIQEEMRLHMDMRLAELQRAGLPEDEARAEARKSFGNLLLLREETRDMWGWRFLDTLAQDLRFTRQRV